MAPTRIYVKPCSALLAQHPVKAWPTSPAAACWKTFRACCPTDTAAHLQQGQLAAHRAVRLAARAPAAIDDHEMNRTFNNGIGMVVVVDAFGGSGRGHIAAQMPAKRSTRSAPSRRAAPERPW